jgi:hypothetical protein
MPKKHKENKKSPNHVTYKKMSKEEIEITRKKLNIAIPTESISGSSKECEAHSCKENVVEKCPYCNRVFCRYHSPPVIATSLDQIQTLNHSSDHEKLEKYNEDWQREDGHPCPAYTGWWNKDHIAKMAAQNTTWTGTWSQGPHRHSKIDEPIYSRPIGHSGQRHKANLFLTILVLIIVVIAAFLLFGYTSQTPTKPKPTGAPYNPYNLLLGYQGSGYYAYNGTEVYANNSAQLNESISNITWMRTSTLTQNSTTLATIAPTTILQTATTQYGVGVMLSTAWAEEFFQPS